MIPLKVLRADPGAAETLEAVARHLEAGGLIAYPTETVYGLGAAATDDGVRAVRDLKGRADDHPFLSLVPSADDLGMNDDARALADAFWPGPLTLVLPDPEGNFPEGARNTDGGVAVRVSSNEFVDALMRVWRRPILSTSANRSGEVPARTAQAVQRAVQGAPGLERLWILDGGPRIGELPSTIVDCTGSPPRLVREGAIERERLDAVVRELSVPTQPFGAFNLLFVCTGNTCRSPLAEVVARRVARDRGLEGLEVRSAGVAASPGAPASGGSVRAAERHGLDLLRHRSTQLTPDLVGWADLVLTMSPGHVVGSEMLGGVGKSAVITEYADPSASPDSYGAGVPDPIGGDDDEYERTFAAIERLVEAVLDRLTRTVTP